MQQFPMTAAAIAHKWQQQSNEMSYVWAEGSCACVRWGEWWRRMGGFRGNKRHPSISSDKAVKTKCIAVDLLANDDVVSYVSPVALPVVAWDGPFVVVRSRRRRTSLVNRFLLWEINRANKRRRYAGKRGTIRHTQYKRRFNETGRRTGLDELTELNQIIYLYLSLSNS